MARTRSASKQPSVRVPLEQLRATWLVRQGLAGGETRSIAELLRDAGWLPSAGGQGVYLALHARRPELGRAEVDRAVIEERRVLELATVRGVTMLVPAEDAALALRAGQRSDDARYARLQKACGVEDAAIERLARAVLDALDGGPRGVEALREAISPGLIQSLGDAGKKLGDATTLSVTLRRLALRGEVTRLPAGGRLDANRFVWTRREPGSLSAAPVEEEEVVDALAARFFAWAGPATRAELAFFAGVGQTEARAIVARLGLVRVEVVGWDEELWAGAEEAEAIARLTAPEPRVAFVPFRDNYVALRRGLGGLVDPSLAGRAVAGWSHGAALLGDAASLHHHAILEGGRLVGVWEYDPGEGRVVWGAFGALSGSQEKAIEAEAEALSAFVGAELGAVVFYALDSEKNRAERLAAVRALGPRGVGVTG